MTAEQFVERAREQGWIAGCWPDGDMVHIFASHDTKRGIETKVAAGPGGQRIIAELAERMLVGAHP